MRTTYRFMLVMLLGGLIASGCANQPAPVTTSEPPLPSEVIAEGHLLPARTASLSFLARGVVENVNVRVGDSVEAGEVLLRLANADQAQVEVVAARQAYDLLLRTADGDRADAWNAYMEAQKRRETAQEEWNDLNLNDIENRIEDRREDVEDRRVDLDQAQRDFDRYRDLNEDDPKYREAEDDLDHAQSDYDIAVKNLESTMRERDVPRADLDAALAAEAEARYQYELSLNGPNADELALAQVRLAAAQDALANYVISAPFDGVVMDVNYAEGEEAGPESWAVKLADTHAWYVETSDLTELEVVKVGPGQDVTILADALPDSPMTGVVERISQASTTQGGDILYRVRMRVNRVDPSVLWGMTVEVTFQAPED